MLQVQEQEDIIHCNELITLRKYKSHEAVNFILNKNTVYFRVYPR